MSVCVVIIPVQKWYVSLLLFVIFNFQGTMWWAIPKILDNMCCRFFYQDMSLSLQWYWERLHWASTQINIEKKCFIIFTIVGGGVKLGPMDLLSSTMSTGRPSSELCRGIVSCDLCVITLHMQKWQWTQKMYKIPPSPPLHKL